MNRLTRLLRYLVAGWIAMAPAWGGAATGPEKAPSRPGELILCYTSAQTTAAPSGSSVSKDSAGPLAFRPADAIDAGTRPESLRRLDEQFGLRRFQPEGTIYLYKPVPSALTPTGYLGRTTIMEFLVMSDPLRRLVMQHAGMGEIEDQARAEGMRTMYEDGLVKALSGVTTIEEVLRVTQEN